METGHYYLKKVAAVFGIDKEEGSRELFRDLEREGIILQFMSPEEFWMLVGQDANLGETFLKQKEVLWITDDGSVGEYFLKKSADILIYLHGDKRQEKFQGGKYVFEGPGEMTAEYLDRIYRRFHKLPWDILETARCMIRETVEEDISDFYEIYKDPEITEYMEDLYDDPEREREYIRQYRENVYEFYEFGVWTVIKKDSGEIIGRAGLSMRAGCDDPELGFVIGKKWQRKGYAFEVLNAILTYGVSELLMDKVQALVEPENEPSLRLCRKLGFEKVCEVFADGIRYERLIWKPKVYIKQFT